MTDNEKRLHEIYKRVNMASGGKAKTADEVVLFLEDEIKHYREQICKYENRTMCNNNVNKNLNYKIDNLYCDIGDLKETIVMLAMQLAGVKND